MNPQYIRHKRFVLAPDKVSAPFQVNYIRYSYSELIAISSIYQFLYISIQPWKVSCGIPQISHHLFWCFLEYPYSNRILLVRCVPNFVIWYNALLRFVTHWIDNFLYQYSMVTGKTPFTLRPTVKCLLIAIETSFSSFLQSSICHRELGTDWKCVECNKRKIAFFPLISIVNCEWERNIF